MNSNTTFSKTIHIENRRDINQFRYFLMAMIGLSFLLFGLCMESPQKILKGLYTIITTSDNLISDYFIVGGIGAAFVNSGILYLVSLGMLYALNITLSGTSISSLFMMAGFGLFGKNILNVWPIILGVYLFSLTQKTAFSKYIYIALFGTAMAPMVTEALILPGYGVMTNFILSLGIGILLGFILPPLSVHMFRVHRGFSLYNIGFTSGLISTVIISVLLAFGYKTKPQLLWSRGNNLTMGFALTIFMVSLIATGFFLNDRSFKNYSVILKYQGRSITDFLNFEGLPLTLINMGAVGLIGIFYVVAVGSELNGPTIGGILSIVGFGAFGKHPKNITPILLGVFIASIFNKVAINNPSIVLAALFGTSLAPISGAFGWYFGILAGFLHSSVVLNVGSLYGGVNLYNNGFAAGLVAAFLIPVIESFLSDEEP